VQLQWISVPACLNPTIETLRRYAAAIGHRIEFVVVAER
jgi:hypothetical protein